MSRHGMVPPGGSPRRQRWHNRHPVLALTAWVLVQEVLIGAVIYACAVATRAAGLGADAFAAMLALLWVLVLFWARRFGMLRPRCWSRIFTEASLLYIGAVGCTTILLIALKLPLWTAQL